MAMLHSGDPEKAKRQLANPPNLRGETPAGAWKPGSAPALKSGLRSRQPSAEVLDPVLDSVIADLESRLPVRDENGQVPTWLREMAWSTAVEKLIVIRCSRFLAQHGEAGERGRWRPENGALVKAVASYERG